MLFVLFDRIGSFGKTVVNQNPGLRGDKEADR